MRLRVCSKLVYSYLLSTATLDAGFDVLCGPSLRVNTNTEFLHQQHGSTPALVKEDGTN